MEKIRIVIKVKIIRKILKETKIEKQSFYPQGYYNLLIKIVPLGRNYLLRNRLTIIEKLIVTNL